MVSIRFLSLFLCACAALAQDGVRPSFEVASLKPSSPESAGGAFPGAPKALQEKLDAVMQTARPVGEIPMVDKSRISLRSQTLLTLIAYAYSLSRDQVSGPGWISDLRFDLDAKLPDGAPAKGANAMLQTLLEDRFSLRFHRETKDAQGFVLVVAKGGPKLQRAGAQTAPENPPDADEAKSRMQQNARAMLDKMQVEGAARSGGGVGGFSRRWQNLSCSMADLSGYLSRQLRVPVTDSTQLEGAYAVTLTVQRSPDEDDASAFSRGLGALGLRLEPHKQPRENLIVDSASREPKEN